MRKKPTWHSNLMRGEVVYLTRSLAAHYVSVGIAEYLESKPAPEAPEVEPQLVDPAVEVVGIPDETKARLNEHWRKTKGKRR